MNTTRLSELTIVGNREVASGCRNGLETVFELACYYTLSADASFRSLKFI